MRDTYQHHDYAVGVIAYSMIQQTPYYLIIHHTKGHWGFPKGHTEHGETTQQTALRELCEETGVTQVSLGDTIYTEHYEFDHKGVHVSKQVDYFIGICDQCRPTTIQPEETIEAGWHTYEQALELITFEQARNLITKINDIIISGQ